MHETNNGIQYIIICSRLFHNFEFTLQCAIHKLDID